MAEFLEGLSEHWNSFESYMSTLSLKSLTGGVDMGALLGLSDLEITSEGENKPTKKSFKVGEETMTWDEVQKKAEADNISTQDFFKRAMTEEQLKTLDKAFRENVKNNLFVSDTQAEAAVAASTAPEVTQAATTTYGEAVNEPPASDPNSELAKQQAQFLEAVQEMWEKQEKRLNEMKEKSKSSKSNKAKYAFEFAKYAVFSGLTLASMVGISNARNGCWTFNTATRSYIEKVDSDTNDRKCNCKGIALVADKPNPCDPYYTAEHPHMCSCFNACNTLRGNDVKHDWTDCGKFCNCVDKNGKPLKAQIELKVVNESIFQTFANVVGGVGLKIIHLGEGVLDVVDASVKSLAQIFRQWWVLLLIVGIPVIIIIIATVVTQVPKRSGIKGGRLKSFSYLHSPQVYGGAVDPLGRDIFVLKQNKWV